MSIYPSFIYDLDDFKDYLDTNNINYNKKKDGYPRMTKKFQKMKDEHYCNKYNEYLQKKNNFLEKKIDININNTNVCNICCETETKGFVKLNCGHDLCASCFAQHMRENNNCPFCRYEICNKPKKILKMPTEMFEALIIKNLANKYKERQCMNINEFVQSQLNKCYEDLKLTEEQEEKSKQIIPRIKYKLMHEIEEIMKDMINDTEGYYMSFA